MRVRLSDYLRRLLGDRIHHAFRSAGYPLRGPVPFGHALHATPCGGLR
jgi:hypothetical protein